MPLTDLNMTEEQLKVLDAHIVQSVKAASKRSFWDLNAAQAFTVAVVLFGAVVSIGWFQRDLDMLKLFKTEISVRVDSIDSKGTVAGRSDISVMKQVVQQHETRLSKVEDARERLLVIENKLDTLTSMQKEMRDKIATK